jgi:hypothetical protein
MPSYEILSFSMTVQSNHICRVNAANESIFGLQCELNLARFMASNLVRLKAVQK